MRRRGFAAVLVTAAALVPLILSGGAGAQTGNEFECVGGMITEESTTAQTCEITETPGRCVEHSTSPVIVQTCTVTQDGTDNDVFVDQVNRSSLQGSAQTATQITNITQGGTNNRADVNQEIRQTSYESGGGDQTQDGRQVTTICQGEAPDCAGINTGTNTARVDQSRWADAHASGGTIRQFQDTVTAGKPTDCDPVRPPAEPDLCTSIEQNSESRNDATLEQQDHLLAEASGSGPITQTQGALSDEGGIDGHAEQLTTAGVQNTEDVHQHLTYDLSAPDTASQSQDPRIGGGSPGGRLNLHQVGILRAGANALQNLLIDGVCEAEHCLVLEHGKVNGANFTTRCNEDGGCVRFIQCTSSSEGGSCVGGAPVPIPLESAGFDTSDFENAINFTFPLSVPLGL